MAARRPIARRLAEPPTRPLIEALARNIYGGGQDDAAARLAAYMRLAVRDLAAAAGRADGRREWCIFRILQWLRRRSEEFEIR